MHDTYLSSSISTSQDSILHNNDLKDVALAEVVFIGNIETIPGWKMDAHIHDYCEIVFIKSGCGKVYIEQTEYDAVSGDLFIYNQGISHSECSSVDNPLSFKVLVIENIFIDGYTNSIRVGDENIQKISLQGFEYEFEEPFNLIINELTENRLGSYLKIKSLLLNIIVFLLRQIYDSIVITNAIRPDIKNQFVRDMLKYIQDNYYKNISLTDIANHTYRSVYYSSHVFKESTGDSPMNYIIKLRIEKAKVLLTNTNLPVGEIASQVGYDDVHHFSNMFKKNIGVSPSVFRKNFVTL